jgi:uncharacterized protein (DUF58 family)
MAVSSYKFIDPHVLASLSNLQLLAKTVITGFMSGVHENPAVGAGLEFNQYRSYQAGDDLRRVDWKMFARSDRYYIRESEIETSVEVQFVLDCSASMLHEENGISKFDYARFLTASLGYLAHHQGDAISLTAIGGDGLRHLRAKREQKHLHRFLHELETLKPNGVFPAWEKIEREFETTHQQNLLVFISDMHETATELSLALRKLTAFKHNIVMLHLVSRNEVEFGYTDTVTFEELETGREIEVDTAAIREKYLDDSETEFRRLKSSLLEQGISYQRIGIHEPLDAALRGYLTSHMKR